jgi:hypothetical protein
MEWMNTPGSEQSMLNMHGLNRIYVVFLLFSFFLCIMPGYATTSLFERLVSSDESIYQSALL